MEMIPYYFGEYDVDNIATTPAQTLWEGKLTYVEFLEKEFFDRFIYIPYEHIQKKLLIIVFLINSKACGKTIPLPCFYFLGKPNSGKSTAAKFIGNHYPSKNFLYLPEDISGGILRDSMAALNRNYPVYILLDNFHPEKTIQRIGAFYGRLLKYTYEESEVSIRLGKRMVQLNTFGLKVFTSIFPLPSSLDELKSRSFYLFFERSERSLDSLELYDWTCLRNEYYFLWGDTRKVSSQIKAVFRELSAINTSINNRRWQLSKFLIAVGMIAGVFREIKEAVFYFEDYFAWIDQEKMMDDKNSLQLLVEEYVRIYPELVAKELNLFGHEAALDINLIYYSDLFDWLKQKLDINKTLFVEKQITEVMRSLGWKIDIVRDKQFRKVDLVFRRNVV